MTYDKKCDQCRVRYAALVDEGGLPKCYECEVRLQGAAIQLLRDMLATAQSAAASVRAEFILVDDRLNGLLAGEASRRSEVDRLRVALDSANAALANATDDLGAAQDEIDALRADLKRYTDVYGDPDAPVDVAHIKVGDHVRCESLGNLTGIVEVVNPSEVPGWDQCLVRDDREGHVWGAAAWILEVLP